MEQHRPPLPWPELRKLHHGLATAPDAQVAKVVAVVDTLETRGVADDVIAPLRARLPQLRLPRPLRFSRLLFAPLNPLVVANPSWRRDSPTIPRSAVPPLAEMVHDAMGREVLAIDGMIRDRKMADADTAREAGRVMWPMAAGILSEASQPPASWARTHLPADCFLILARRVAILLEQTAALDSLFAAAESGVALEPECLTPLVAAGSQDAVVLAMIAALLLTRLPEARDLFGGAARRLGSPDEATMRLATDQALEVLLERLEAPSGIETLVIGSSLGGAAAEIRQIRDLLDGLMARPGYDDRSSRLQTMLDRLDAGCRLRFAIALEVEFAAALQGLSVDADQTALSRLEEVAGHLRNLEQEARRVGSEDSYDALLHQVAEQIRRMPSGHAFDLMDRVRLVEILAGSDEALAMLDAADTVEA